MRASVLVLAALLAVTIAYLMWFQPLSPERVNSELGADPDLVFVFATGHGDKQVGCGQADALDDGSAAQTAVAIGVGWVARRCVGGHVDLRLTPEGERLSSHWSRSTEPGSTAQAPDPGEGTEWLVTAARFERIGEPEIRSTPYANRRRVVVNGRWVLDGDGERLRRARWEALRSPAVRDEEFERRITGWHRIPKVIGRDLSGL